MELPKPFRNDSKSNRLTPICDRIAPAHDNRSVVRCSRSINDLLNSDVLYCGCHQNVSGCHENESGCHEQESVWMVLLSGYHEMVSFWVVLLSGGHEPDQFWYVFLLGGWFLLRN